MDLFERTVRQQQTKYWGKYRAFVADNRDPQKRGRCKLTIPSVLGEAISDWALPCLPFGGAAGLGFVAVPPKDAQVVAEFLEGDASAPMWTGTFWREGEAAPEAFTAGEAPTAKVMRSDSGHQFVFEDKAGEESLSIASKAEARIELDSEGSLLLTDSAGAKVLLDAQAHEIHVEDANGHSLVLSSSGIVAKDAAGNEISTSASGVTVKGATVTIEGSSVSVGGAGGEPLLRGQTFMALFNAHVHNCTAPGSPSGPPAVPLTPAILTAKANAS